MDDSAMFTNYGVDFGFLGGVNIGGALPGLGGHGDVQVFDMFHGGIHDAMSAIGDNLPTNGPLPGLGGPIDVHLIGSDGHDYALHYDPHTATVHMPDGRDVAFSQHDYSEFMAAESSRIHDQYAAFHTYAKHGHAIREFYGGPNKSVFVGKYLEDGRFQMLDGRVFDYLPANAIAVSPTLTHGHYTPIAKPDHSYDAFGNYLLGQGRDYSLDLNNLGDSSAPGVADPTHAKIALDINDLEHAQHNDKHDDRFIFGLERDLTVDSGWEINPDGTLTHHGPLPLNPDGSIDISGLPSELPKDRLPAIILPEDFGSSNSQKFDWASTMPPGWSVTSTTVDQLGTEHITVTLPNGSSLELSGSNGIYEVGPLIPSTDGLSSSDSTNPLSSTTEKLLQHRLWLQIDKDWQPTFDVTKDGFRELVLAGPKGEVIRLDDRDGYLGVRSITPGIGQILPDDGERIPATVPSTDSNIASIVGDYGIGGGRDNAITLGNLSDLAIQGQLPSGTHPVGLIPTGTGPTHMKIPQLAPHPEFLTPETRDTIADLSHQVAQSVGKAAIATVPFLVPLLIAP